MKEYIKKLVKAYFLITTCSLTAAAIFTTIFIGNQKVGVELLWQILVFSMVATLSILLLYSKKELTKRQMIVRQTIHYIVINVLLICCASYFEWINIKNVKELIAFIIMIIVVYILVEVGMYQGDIKQADKLNRKIKEYQQRK